MLCFLIAHTQARTARDFGLDVEQHVGVVAVDAALVAARARRDQCLPLGIPRASVRVISHTRDIDAIDAGLSEDTYVGLDTEWVGIVARGETSKTAVVQLAGSTSVFLVDMVSLSASAEALEALDAVLVRVCGRSVVCGFGAGDDLRRVSASYPSLTWAKRVPRLLDVQTLASRVLGTPPHQKANSKIAWSLSHVCERVLGSPLDKDERMR